jgi:hypothetical protein
MSTDRPDGEEPYSGIPQAGGIILRMLLGTQLRRLRVGFKARDITDLLSLHGRPAMAQRAVEHYLVVADQLRGEALTPAASKAFSEQAAKET